MKIAPIDIAHKSFGRKMMGFDPDEVMDFLRQVSDELENVIKEKNHLKEALREKELQVIEFRDRDNLLRDTITTATKMSEKIQTDAEREARLILNDANQKSEMIVRDSRDSLKNIYQDIADLKKVRMQFEGNLKAILQSHMTMLEQGNKIMPNPSIQETMLESAGTPQTQEDETAIERNVSEAIEKAAQNFEV